MAKLTLLQMVTSIMSDMDSDAITSINDTPESLQVASIIQDVYFQYIADIEVPELEQLLQFTTVGVTHPNYLQIPTNVQRINWIKYDKHRSGDLDIAFDHVNYMKPEDFVEFTFKRKSSDPIISTITDPTNTAVSLLIENDKPPEWYTCFDDVYLCFDSYDSAVDSSGLIASKSLTWGQVIPTWSVTDGFVPVLDDNLFPFLLAESKATCFMNIKQVQNPKVEKQSRFQRIMTSNDRFRTKKAEQASINGQYAGPNFGRRSARALLAGNQIAPGWRE